MKIKLLWIAVCALTLMVIGQGWYIHQVDVRAAAAPSTVSGQASINELKARVDQLVANQQAWNRHEMSMDARFDQLSSNQRDWNRHIMALDARTDNVEQAARAMQQADINASR